MQYLNLDFKYVKRAVIATFGFTVLLIGFALIFLPGPAIIVIPIGLLILAGEFIWARKMLNRFKKEFGKLQRKI